MYERLRAYTEARRASVGASEQAVCRELLDAALTAVGHPPTEPPTGGKRRRKGKA